MFLPCRTSLTEFTFTQVLYVTLKRLAHRNSDNKIRKGYEILRL